MKPTVTFLAMTQKGAEVVQYAFQRNRAMVEQVIIGRDYRLADDGSERLVRLCLEAGVPHSFRENTHEIRGDYVIAVSWRWMVNGVSDRLIVMHDSLLPKYRGFAPLPNALINGEKEIGVTALYASDEYDCGDIIFQSGTRIDYPITIQKAIEINNANYRVLVDRIFTRLQDGLPLPRTPQSEKDATYSIWRDKEDYRIDWQRSAEEIERLVNAVGPPYSGAVTYTQGSKIIVQAVTTHPDVKCELRHVGKVIFVEDGCPIVICGQGLLKIVAACLDDSDGAQRPFLPVNRFRMRFE